MRSDGSSDGTQMVGQPAYARVAEDLRRQIGDGRLPVGTPIPSSTQLCAIYDVSTTVARAAVNQLRTEGLLVGQPGKGVFVRATPQVVEQETIDLHSVAAAVERLTEQVTGLAEREQGSEDMTELRDEVRDLRRHVAVLHSHLMELYARLGQPYPHDGSSAPADSARAASESRS